MFEHSQKGVVNVVSGNNPLNIESVEELSELFNDLFSQGKSRIAFDLQEVALIDSAGLELLLDVQDKCLQRGGELKLAAPTALCQEILDLTEVTSHIEIMDDLTLAMGSFAQ